MWPAQCQGLRRRQHRTEQDKGHTPNPRTEIKIPDPAGNRIWAAGFEGRNSTDHATATDNSIYTTHKYDALNINFTCHLGLSIFLELLIGASNVRLFPLKSVASCDYQTLFSLQSAYNKIRLWYFI